jgi:hypothetical protein
MYGTDHCYRAALRAHVLALCDLRSFEKTGDGVVVQARTDSYTRTMSRYRLVHSDDVTVHSDDVTV